MWGWKRSSSFEPGSVLITGCSSGIGYVAAHFLADRGWWVFPTARQQADVDRLKREGFQDALRLDLDVSVSIESAMDAVQQRTGGTLDALFNNGAYGQPGAVEDLSRAALRYQFETNLFGTHELTTHAVRVMRRQGHGRIVQNSSVLGFAALPYRGAYVSTKFALEGLTDALRQELVDTNIHVSLIEPGPIESRFRENAWKAFQRNVDARNSPHAETYEAIVARLQGEGDETPFTLGPDSVVDRLIHALESDRPRARYPVTVPTYAFAVLKRLLPTRAMDWVLLKATESERQLQRPDTE